MRYIEFRTIERNGIRPYIISIADTEIKKIETQFGSENCYLKVNGIAVEGGYEYLIRLLACSNKVEEDSILEVVPTLAPFKVYRT